MDEQRIHQKVVRLFNEALKRYLLIEDGDRVLIGLSGGKDSMALLQLLGQRAKVFFPRFSVEAAYVRMTNIPYQNDEEYLKSFAKQYDVPLHIVETSFDESTDKRHTHCFLCSWQRRKMLFNTAQALGCNKIAFGHHKDDFIQTALMNVTFQGHFSTMRPTMQMDKFPIILIRPLCLIRENDMQAFAQYHGYRQQIKNCPYEDASHRYSMKEIITQLEQMNPEFEYSFYRAIEDNWDLPTTNKNSRT